MPILPVKNPGPGHRTVSIALILTALAAGCDTPGDGPTAPAAPARPAAAEATALATPTVFATGLRFPRGFAFGPDGALYVAEAGLGGSHSTRASECRQVAQPFGPYSNGTTARISRIGPHGNRSTVASGFPSAISAMGDVDGVADVAFIDGQLYALVAGGGCSHGSRRVADGIAKVSPGGDWSIVADLGAYALTHPVAHSNPGDFEPEGVWYSMLAVDGKLFTVEPNHGDVVRVVPGTWKVSRIVDVSASQGHIVPTALAQRFGNLYFGNLGVFPVTPGSQKVFQLKRDGTLIPAKGGFTTILGLDFDSHGRMYVLETTHGAGFPTPGTGRVVRVNGDGTRQVIVNGLFFPTAMRFGPDGGLYISNKGFGPPQPGEILRVDVH